MEPLRTAVVAQSFVLKQWSAALASQDASRIRFTALWASTLEEAQSLNTQFFRGTLDCYSNSSNDDSKNSKNLNALIMESEIDAVIVALSPELHADVVEGILNFSKKHVLSLCVPTRSPSKLCTLIDSYKRPSATTPTTPTTLLRLMENEKEKGKTIPIKDSDEVVPSRHVSQEEQTTLKGSGGRRWSICQPMRYESAINKVVSMLPDIGVVIGGHISATSLFSTALCSDDSHDTATKSGLQKELNQLARKGDESQLTPKNINATQTASNGRSSGRRGRLGKGSRGKERHDDVGVSGRASTTTTTTCTRTLSASTTDNGELFDGSLSIAAVLRKVFGEVHNVNCHMTRSQNLLFPTHTNSEKKTQHVPQDADILGGVMIFDSGATVSVNVVLSSAVPKWDLTIWGTWGHIRVVWDQLKELFEVQRYLKHFEHPSHHLLTGEKWCIASWLESIQLGRGDVNVPVNTLMDLCVTDAIFESKGINVVLRPYYTSEE